MIKKPGKGEDGGLKSNRYGTVYNLLLNVHGNEHDVYGMRMCDISVMSTHNVNLALL